MSRNNIQAYEIISGIASEVGKRHDVFLQINFPPGGKILEIEKIGHRDLTILVDRSRRTFRVSANQVKDVFAGLKPLKIGPVGFGHEGFKVELASGRIDCFPSGIHLWCEITPEVLPVLDWLFTNAY